MKKLLTILLTMAIIMSLAACGTKEAEKSKDKKEETKKETQVKKKEVKEEKEEVEKEEIEANIEVDENYFFNEQNSSYDIDSVSIKPRYVYWENGTLVAECFVINGFSHAVHSLNVDSLTFSNESGEIASAGFGALEGVMLPAYSNVVWTFTFDADFVSIQDAELSSLTTNASVSYAY